ncbi:MULTISPECIES: hypothetical protein [Ruminococcus]|uniref:Uncharacterized protein n=1 Tax=Ruminococcus flavefaciens TaxID=1265 RepID=A0A1M7L1F3_RUMFL|nr:MULTISPECIES: hypothetical protein [Ruminococcus]MCR4796514.1 hypothetical protein [Ruminococcus sp.]SHM71604.1 hypothetical protein SAMN04487860_1116 [Ruminococcus flavefaciens]
MLVLNRAGCHSQIKKVESRKGTIVVENLLTDKTDVRRLKNAETELYKIFAKYRTKNGI